MQQGMHLTAYEEHTTATSHKLDRLRHENAILRSGAPPPLAQDRKLQVTYRRLSEAEHGWNYTRQLHMQISNDAKLNMTDGAYKDF
jgi:hypothetical protein